MCGTCSLVLIVCTWYVCACVCVRVLVCVSGGGDRRNNGDSFVEMMQIPVAHMDEDSPRSRAHSALLFPDDHNIDHAVHNAQARYNEDRFLVAQQQ